MIEPCVWCEVNKGYDVGSGPFPNHGKESPHCKYCGQALGDDTPITEFHYLKEGYFGHLRCILQAVGPMGELYYRRLVSGEATQQEIADNNPPSR